VVKKLRKQALDTKIEMQEKKKSMNEERLIQWPSNPKTAKSKSKSKTRKIKKNPLDRMSDIGDEMQTVEPIEQQLYGVDVTDKAMKLMKKNDKKAKAD